MGLADGKSGIVTGAASGIGRASAIYFAKEGGSVVVADLESQRERAEETVGLIEKAGGQGLFVPADVANSDDHERLVAECVSAFGRLDFAHNNAGINEPGGMEEASVESWYRVLGVNLTGVFLGMKHQLKQMRAQGDGGAIVNTASLAGVMAVPQMASYTASKFGVVGITQAAAIEAADIPVRVNAVCPGSVRTPQSAGMPEHIRAQLTGPHAIKRLLEPEEIAATVVWLCSDHASGITGAAIATDLGAGAGIKL
jgi:NAD(P)-dependent dehydrogenase (short-subunit alcohol dehydrogenase family)